ncbi:hypothetical protein LXN57_40880 [Actinoplanes sp. TRM88002]|uniref:DUF6545 domain-containing protein n=1 Tax=Paractinoplanes hotanensis TaxID=2906497 RepID=A0ABT0YCZ3_9ACTN|nr:hypothetical protein [Actinoplanes hotanensis]
MAYKGIAVRRNPRNARLWAVLFTIAVPATGITIATDGVYSAIARVSGQPHLPTLLMYCCCVGYSISAFIMTLLLKMPAHLAKPLIVRYIIFFTLSITTMIILFFNIRADEADPLGMERAYAQSAVGGLFLLIFLGSFAAGLIAEARQSLQFARQVAATGGRPWLQLGLQYTAAGALLAISYCATKALSVVAAWVGLEIRAIDILGTILVMLGALTMTLGLTMPAWGPHCSSAKETLRQAITYVQLHSLWAELVAQYPGIALDKPQSRLVDFANLRDLGYRLNRRVIEINDGILAVQSQASTPEQSGEIAIQLKLPEGVVQTAMRIREAARVNSNRRNQFNPSLGSPSAVEHAASEEREVEATVDDIGWLVQLATALRRLPA